MKAASAVASTASAVAGQQANGAAGSPSAASMYPAMENLRQALYNFHRGTAAGNGNVVLAGASSSSASSTSTSAAAPASGTVYSRRLRENCTPLRTWHWHWHGADRIAELKPGICRNNSSITIFNFKLVPNV